MNLIEQSVEQISKESFRNYYDREQAEEELMGHKSRSMTEHYSVPELRRLLNFCSKVTEPPTTQMDLEKTFQFLLTKI